MSKICYIFQIAKRSDVLGQKEKKKRGDVVEMNNKKLNVELSRHKD